MSTSDDQELKDGKVDLVSPQSYDKSHYVKGGIFLASVTGMSILFGFGMTLAMAKKKDPNFFNKGLLRAQDAPESGPSLALRALRRATLYSVSGFSLFGFAVWKAMGVHNLQEFREKMQSFFSGVPKPHSEGRTEFNSIRELFQYLIDEDKGKKKS